MYRAFPVAQMVKNLPAMKETQVRSLGQEDPLEKATATHSSILAWRVHGVAKSQTRLSDFTFFLSFFLHTYITMCEIASEWEPAL